MFFHNGHYTHLGQKEGEDTLIFISILNEDFEKLTLKKIK